MWQVVEFDRAHGTEPLWKQVPLRFTPAICFVAMNLRSYCTQMLGRRFEEHNRAWLDAVGDATNDGEGKEYSRDVSCTSSIAVDTLTHKTHCLFLSRG